jgi:LysM repeat protein
MIKRIQIVIIFIFCSISIFAQQEKARAYISLYKDVAIAEMQRSGVPAAITLAQGMLESGYGESELCKKSNNHFGIKCKEEWTGEKVYHDDDSKQECFRAYPSASESYKDHSDFLKSRPWYGFLFKLDPTDYEGWATGLKKAGYATEKDYANRLIKIINDYNLQQFSLSYITTTKKADEIPVKKDTNQTAQTTAAITLFDTPAISSIKKDTAITIEKEEPADTMVTLVEAQKVDMVVQKKSKYADGIFTINHSKVFYAKEGTSLLSIANKYGIALSKLLAFNDMQEMDILNADTLIFIEPKLKKGASDFHVVNEGETIHSISQTEGIQQSSLFQYNSIKSSIVLKKDEKIYLRPRTAKSSK